MQSLQQQPCLPYRDVEGQIFEGAGRGVVLRVLMYTAPRHASASSGVPLTTMIESRGTRMLQPFTNIDILTHGAGLATEGIASSSKLARGTPYAHFRARRCGLACHIKGLRDMGFEGQQPCVMD